MPRDRVHFIVRMTGCSGQTHAIAAADFENGEKIAHAEEFADPRIQVQQLQFTLCAFRRNVKSHQRPQTGTIHVPEFAKVQDQPPLVRQQSLYFRFQVRRSFGGEPARATHHGRVFPSIGVEIQSPPGNQGISGHGSAYLLWLPGDDKPFQRTVAGVRRADPMEYELSRGSPVQDDVQWSDLRGLGIAVHQESLADFGAVGPRG